MSAKIEKLIQDMSPEDKIGQMMVLSFRTTGKDFVQPVTGVNESVLECMEWVRPGGIVLFRENCLNAEQTLRFISQLQIQNRRNGSAADLIIATDQEGGRASRIGYGTPGPGNMALGTTGDPDNAYRMAEIIGKELKALGINTDLAPVADINNNPANPVIGDRSFGTEPEKVSMFTEAFQAGLHSEGIIDTLKHFPGHGDTDTDSHTGLPLIDKTPEELRENELIPFRFAIREGADIVMTAHIRFPKVDPTNVICIKTRERITVPATMSKRILTDILRGELGFDGVIMSDAMEMKAISEFYSVDDTLCLMIRAGVDMLLLPAVRKDQDFEMIGKIRDRIIRLVEMGQIGQKVIDDSVRRILRLKEKYGMLGDRDYELNREKILEAKNIVGCKEHKRIVQIVQE